MATPILDFADLLRSGSPTLTGWLGLAHPLLVDVIAREQVDSITFDMQHGMHDTDSIVGGISMAALAGKPSVVRIPVGDFSYASRALDFGAMGVIAPMINSVEDARAFAAACKYPPLGERSWGPIRAVPISGLAPGEYFAQANRRTVAIAMIETRAAMDALEGILAVPGIDGVFVGPSDLSIALFDGTKVDALSAEVDAAFDHVVARAKAHGKFATAFAMSGAHAAKLGAKGYTMCTLCNDTWLIQQGIRTEIKAARAGAVSGAHRSY